MIPLIKKLAEAYGPSGRESGLRRIVRGEIEGRCDSVTEDRMGNLIGVIKPKSGTGFRIMLAAHLDEIGLIVSHVDERGFARFSPIGKVYPVYCAGGRVRFESGATGVIGLERREDETRIPALEHFYLDLGVRAGADCPVRMGDTAVFDRPLVESGGRLIAKAMDDRVGVAILVETMRRLERTPHEIQFVFTVQEELGARGARTSAYGLDPEIGIAVDVTPSGDTPRGLGTDITLGKGPAVKVRDSGMVSDRRIVEWMTAAADARRIPHQMEVLEHGTTDAAVIQAARAGVPAGCLSIPCRYNHSPSEMVDLDDVENAVQLLLAMLQGAADFNP